MAWPVVPPFLPHIAANDVVAKLKYLFVDNIERYLVRLATGDQPEMGQFTQQFCSTTSYFHDFTLFLYAFGFAFSFSVLMYLIGVITGNEKLKLYWKLVFWDAVMILVFLPFIPKLPCMITISGENLYALAGKFFTIAKANILFPGWFLSVINA